jgi:hypothetical protein
MVSSEQSIARSYPCHSLFTHFFPPPHLGHVAHYHPQFGPPNRAVGLEMADGTPLLAMHGVGSRPVTATIPRIQPIGSTTGTAQVC